MKRIILLIGVMVALSTVFVFGQAEGVINYELKINMHRRLPKENAEMKNMIPEFRTLKFQLFYTASESLYKPFEEEEDEEINDGNGMQIRMRMPQSEIYVNPADEKIIELTEFLDRKYLITDTLKANGWKLGAETKTILGFECKSATKYDAARDQKITAWYTDKLRTSLGPDRHCALPGAVLEVNVNDSERVFTAKKIDARPLKKGELKTPSGGTAMSGAEYRKMVDEQMKKMGGQGGIVIRRN